MKKIDIINHQTPNNKGTKDTYSKSQKKLGEKKRVYDQSKTH